MPNCTIGFLMVIESTLHRLRQVKGSLQSFGCIAPVHNLVNRWKRTGLGPRQEAQWQEAHFESRKASWILVLGSR